MDKFMKTQAHKKVLLFDFIYENFKMRQKSKREAKG